MHTHRFYLSPGMIANYCLDFRDQLQKVLPLFFLEVYQIINGNFIDVYNSKISTNRLYFFSTLIINHALLAIKRVRNHSLAKYILHLKCFALEIKRKYGMSWNVFPQWHL